MKKLMIVPVVALGLLFSTNTTAQEAEVVEKETAMLTVKADQQVQVKEYTKIELNQVPAAVQTAVTTDFEGAAIVEAHVAEDSTYKLVVNLNGENKTLYADANGNWIKQ